MIGKPIRIQKFGAAVFTASMFFSSSFACAESLKAQYVLAQAADNISKAEAAEIAKKKYGGKVLKIEKVGKDDKSYFRVRLLLEDGRVKTLKVDAQKGAIS